MGQIWQRYTDQRYVTSLRALRFRLAATRLVLWSEFLSRRFWPLWTLILFTYTFVSFGGIAALPVFVGRGFAGLVLALGLYLAFRGVRGWNFPSRQMAIDRLDNSDAGTPLASLRDHPAAGSKDAFTRDLWEAHQSNMAARATKLVPGLPNLQLSAYDRNGLRFMALICAMAAFLFAPSGSFDATKSTLLTGSQVLASGPTLEAWATPPQYTGKPQIYLGEVENGGTITIATGTEISIQVYGGSENITIAQDISEAEISFVGDQNTVRNSSFEATKNGSITILDSDEPMASWQFFVKADKFPTVAANRDLGQTSTGAMELPFTATDDYGVVAGTAEIQLQLTQIDRRFGLAAEPDPMPPLSATLPMPFRGDTDKISEVLVEDFSKSIWVGLPVTITLLVTDAVGQTGQFEISATLPGKRFFVPLAAALVEQRRDLLWAAENERRVFQVLLALTNLPEDLALGTGTYLKLRTTIRRMEQMLSDGLDNDERENIAESLWELAIFLEDGDLGDAKERLRRAQEKLMEAIEQNAEREEISKLMDELRDATDDYMEMLAEKEQQQAEQSAENSAPADGRDRLRDMLDELQRLAENGDEDAARDLLQEMQQMMDDMQLADQQNGGNSDRVQELQDSLQQQQSLSDQTFQQLQQLLDNQQAQDGIEQSLADQQEALREFLESLAEGDDQNTSGSTGAAEENMGSARDNLENGNLGDALNDQAEAIENLRNSIRNLGEEMQQAGQGRNGLQEGETQNDTPINDPLGRPLGRTGTADNGETLVPDGSESERARELLDEIRRRSGDLSRPDVELEYLKRLLERF